MNSKTERGSEGEGRLLRLFDTARRFGVKAAARTALLWVLRQLVAYRAAVVYRLDLRTLEPPESLEGFSWDYRSADRVAPVLLRAAEVSTDQAEISHARYFVGELNRQPCYFSVVADRGFAIPDRIRVTFNSEVEAYVGNCITLNEYRGRGIYPRGLSELGVSLGREGFRWLYLFVERENVASIRGVEKAHFMPVLDCSVYTCFGHTRRTSRIRPGIGEDDVVKGWKIGWQDSSQKVRSGL